MKTLFQTADNWQGTFIRITLAVVLFPHGAQKLFGWYGGFGFTNTMAYFTDTVGLPWLIALLVILLESLGAVALFLGLAGRFLGASVAVLMLGILFTSHLDYGFFMNWFGTQKGEGMEYFFLFIGLSATLAINGSGKFSIDKLLSKTMQAQTKKPLDISKEPILA